MSSQYHPTADVSAPGPHHAYAIIQEHWKTVTAPQRAVLLAVAVLSEQDSNNDQSHDGYTVAQVSDFVKIKAETVEAALNSLAVERRILDASPLSSFPRRYRLPDEVLVESQPVPSR